MRILLHGFIIVAFAALVSAGVNAGEPLPKRGTLSGTFGWHVSSGEFVQVDKDHIIWGGTASGPFLSDGGSRLLHGAAVICTFSGEFKKDAVTHNGGDCVATDGDGDKATMRWKCTRCPEAGEIQLTNGTGKYAGIVGSGTFQQSDAGPPGSKTGSSVWKAKWDLP